MVLVGIGFSGVAFAFGVALTDLCSKYGVVGSVRSRYIHAPGLAVGIHRRLVRFSTDLNSDRVAGFHVVIDFTGHGNRLTRFAGVNHVIGRDIIDRDRRGWYNRIDAISMSRIGGGNVACGVTRGDGGTHIAVRSQHGTRNIHTPGRAIGIHRRLVGLGTDFHRHRIAGFDVVIDFTGHHNGLAGLAGVNHVIGRDIIDTDRRHWRHGINTVSVSRIGGSDVACRIARGHGGRNISVRSKNRTRNVDAPSLAIGIDGRLVRFGADFNGDGITCFNLIIDFTSDRDGLTRFAGIDDVV
ncbi:hypothetical protein GJS26_03215 [Pectobacterium carotovorum subsp. carotovorum]|nr:hypothetical protein [Pectobacterium carotovorum subsp. carotovorum]